MPDGLLFFVAIKIENDKAKYQPVIGLLKTETRGRSGKVIMRGKCWPAVRDPHPLPGSRAYRVCASRKQERRDRQVSQRGV